MPQYAKDHRRDYDEGKISAVELVKRVLNEANGRSDKSKGERLAERGITTLYKLSKGTSLGKSFPIKEIYKKGRIDPLQTPSAGLWVWDDRTGCGIVEKVEGTREYRIKNEFRKAVQRVL